MSTCAGGSVVDENGAPLSGLDVYLDDASRVLVVSLAKTTTDNAGQFSLTYADDLTVSNEPGKQVRPAGCGRRCATKSVAAKDRAGSLSIKCWVRPMIGHNDASPRV